MRNDYLKKIIIKPNENENYVYHTTKQNTQLNEVKT